MVRASESCGIEGDVAGCVAEIEVTDVLLQATQSLANYSLPILHNAQGTTMHPLPKGTEVQFDIAQGLAVGAGKIVNSHFDEGWFYEIEVTSNGSVDEHRNQAGQLWVCEFEITASTRERNQ